MVKDLKENICKINKQMENIHSKKKPILKNKFEFRTEKIKLLK